ncbi:secreted protein, partial [Candidatus Magnetoovum chiemensis]
MSGKSGFLMLLMFVIILLTTNLAEAAKDGDDAGVIKNFAVVGFPTIAKGSDNDWLGVGLGDDLATRLAQVEGMISVERFHVNEMLAINKINMLREGIKLSEYGLLVSEDTDIEEKKRLLNIGKVIEGGEMIAASYVIVGSLWMDGPYGEKDTTIKANARVVNTKTSQVLKAVSVEGAGDTNGYMRLQEDLADA